MTTREALRILSLHAPISRETLNQVYEAALRDAGDDDIHPIYQAYSHLFDLADDEFPFQPEAVAGMTWQQQRPGLPAAATPRPRHMQPQPQTQDEEIQNEPLQSQDAAPQPRPQLQTHSQQPPPPPLQPYQPPQAQPHSPQQARTFRPPPVISTLAADPLPLEGGPAPFYYRICAGIIDFIVYAIVAGVFGFNQAFLNSRAPGPENTSTQLHLLMGFLFILTLLYFVLMESSAQQGTLGKQACGIIVTGLDGQRLSRAQALRRFLAKPFSILTLGIGLLMALWTRNRQCLHDMAGKSIVLRKESTHGRPLAVTAVSLGIAGVVGIMLYMKFLGGTEIAVPADAGAPPPTADAAYTPATPAPVVSTPPAKADLQTQYDMLNNGVKYLIGNGVPVDSVEAVKWFRKGAEMGEFQCQGWLGHCLMDGEGVTQDVPEALKWLRKSAEQGFPMAMYYLGNASREGKGVPKDATEAVRWYRLAAAGGDAEAQYELGMAQYTGEGVAQDLPAAAEWFRKAAGKDNPSANYMLGLLYATGDGVTRDDAKAVEHYRKAADSGLAIAQNGLALCYQYGTGVPKDPALAAQWYARAAEQGNAKAQYSLGTCYETGTGVPKDVPQAMMWYAKSADQGYSQAQYWLGTCHQNGKGVPKDAALAVKWFQKAADQGLAGAQNDLGICHANGTGVAQSPIIAVTWYTKAAEQGLKEAQFNLAGCYETGSGIETDLVNAMKWYLLASAQGYPDAAAKVRELQPLLTVEDYVRAQVRVDAFQKALKK